MFDRCVPWFEEPWYNTDDPDYEEPLLTAVEKSVSEGDKVVIVGGGWGISAVVAALEAGDSGHVTVYEGAKERITNIEDAVELNCVQDRVTVNHAVVGEVVHLTGAANGASWVAPDELPESDVIEMDCEGAETEIIPHLENYPEILIVETHRNESSVNNQMAVAGYEIVNRGVEKTDEIYVLTGKLL